MSSDSEIKKEEVPSQEKKEGIKASKPPKDKVIKVKESEKKRWIEEVDEYKDKYLRLYAEFENARKRMERDKMEFIKYANEKLIEEFLDIVDNFDRCVESAKTKHEDYAAFLKGVEMISGQMNALLKKHNVSLIEAKGKVFDPNCHEVLMQEEVDDLEEGIVLEEFQRGYTLNAKVVRTSKVKLSKKRQPQNNNSNSEEKTSEEILTEE